MSKAPTDVNPESLNTVARRVLLDGLNALHDHLDAITVVGAQAVYLRSADAELATAAYTSDGDLGLDPELLADEPRVNEALAKAGFLLRAANQPGLWVREEVIDGKEVSVELDLLIGGSLAKGGRGARIPPHDKMTARRVPGLETATVDRDPMTITALDSDDERSITVHVAGVVALLVAKAHKIKDRLADFPANPGRLVNKDAGDVYRLMITSRAREVATDFTGLIADSRVGTVTDTGLRYLREQFGGADTPGIRLAIEALAGDVPAERIRAVAPAFVRVLPPHR